MNQTTNLVESVRFEAGYDADSLAFNQNQNFGFLELQATSSVDRLNLVGFGMPFSPLGGFETGQMVTPLAELNAVPSEFRTIDIQGKGVGPRLFNTLQATSGMQWQPAKIGLYAFTVAPEAVLDFRIAQGTKAAQLASHAARMVGAKLRGLDRITDDIHEQYGDAKAVLLGSPPLPEARRAHRGVSKPSGIRSNFFIIRAAELSLTKIGEADAPRLANLAN